MSNIQFTEAQISMWVQQGLQTAVERQCRDSYGHGPIIKQMIEKGMTENKAAIQQMINTAIMNATVNPNLLKTIEDELAKSMANAYKGAFESVIKAAAKNAANNEIIAQRVAALTKQAAGVE